MPSNELTAKTALYYQPGEVVERKFTKESAGLQCVRFIRLSNRRHVELNFANGLIDELHHRYVYHSPDGFEWGYYGSGPAELALNLLAFFIGVKNATEGGLYQRFKEVFVAALSQRVDVEELQADTMRRWIEQQWEVRDGV